MGLIVVERSFEVAGFHSPLAGMEYVERELEVRRDPLTGMTAIASSELAKKEETFYGATDWAAAEELATSSREGCFFCSERVMESTPRYPEEVVPGGRLRRGRALVFPNLFPLAAVHAVVTYPDEHALRPSEFTPSLLEEGIGAAVEFAGHAERNVEGLEHLQLCCNHMLPAGASLVHPHFQIFAGAGTPWLIRLGWECAEAFAERHGVSYWRTLVDEEITCGERYIAGDSDCAWLSPFAPQGGREVLAVLPGVSRVSALSEAQVAELAAGLSRVLAWYEREGLSAFNFTLGGGPLSGSAEHHAVTLRVIARSAFRHNYRTDDYYLQKQLGGELIFASPEEMATVLRGEFAGR